MLVEPAGASTFLGPLAQELLSAVCPDAVRNEIATLLADSCSIGLLDRERPVAWGDFVDRVQLAALRGSGWDVDKIRHSVALASLDWRNLLVQADFAADLSAHRHGQVSALRSGSIV